MRCDSVRAYVAVQTGRCDPGCAFYVRVNSECREPVGYAEDRLQVQVQFCVLSRAERKKRAIGITWRMQQNAVRYWRAHVAYVLACSPLRMEREARSAHGHVSVRTIIGWAAKPMNPEPVVQVSHVTTALNH